MIQSIVRTEKYDEELLFNAVCRHFETLKIADELKPEMKVVIKPNFVMAVKPEAAATTHPLLINMVLIILL